MLSGRRAFRGDSAAETMAAILKEDPPELSATAQNVSPALERVVDHCLEKNPEQRFQSARDLAFHLDALSSISSAPASRFVRSARRAAAQAASRGRSRPSSRRPAWPAPPGGLSTPRDGARPIPPAHVPPGNDPDARASRKTASRSSTAPPGTASRSASSPCSAGRRRIGGGRASAGRRPLGLGVGRARSGARPALLPPIHLRRNARPGAVRGRGAARAARAGGRGRLGPGRQPRRRPDS